MVYDEPTAQPALGLIQRWITECTEKHETCSPGVTPLPTRVLDLGDGSPSAAIRLWETEGAHGRYATLSHCWGGLEPLMTTRETLEERKAGIRLGDMPKTFQDAVMITRLLGVRYLWIDSLCICQHDSADWEHEGSRMEDVYSNSYVTIAAAGAPNGTVGCFVPRPPRRSYTPFRYTSTGGVRGQVFSCLVPPEGTTANRDPVALAREPLSGRAWTFQERALSPRTVFCCSDQFYFECKEAFRGENGFVREGRYLDLDEIAASREQSLEGVEKHLADAWAAIAGKYSTRKLTVATDRLPALSGLTKRFAKMYKLDPTDYAAGLWKSALVDSLLWKRGGTSVRWPLNPQEYRAPTWSWASTVSDFTTAEEWLKCPKFVKAVDVQVVLKGRNRMAKLRVPD